MNKFRERKTLFRKLNAYGLARGTSKLRMVLRPITTKPEI